MFILIIDFVLYYNLQKHEIQFVVWLANV